MSGAVFLTYDIFAVLILLKKPMKQALSKRLNDIVNALPLREGTRVLEIGCGPGSAARAVCQRVQRGYVLGIDRSKAAISQAIKSSGAEIASGRLNFIQCRIEEFELPEGEDLFDMAFAVRVGALDGRHPEVEAVALERIRKVLKKKGKLFIDGGDPLKEVYY